MMTFEVSPFVPVQSKRSSKVNYSRPEGGGTGAQETLIE